MRKIAFGTATLAAFIASCGGATPTSSAQEFAGGGGFQAASSVLQMSVSSDCTEACVTTSSVMVPLSGMFSVRPVSQNSNLLIDCSFQGYVDLAAGNTVGLYQIYEMTNGSAPLGQRMELAAILASFGARAAAPVTVRAVVPNAQRDTRTFELWGAMSQAPGSTAENSVSGMICTVTEISAGNGGAH